MLHIRLAKDHFRQIGGLWVGGVDARNGHNEDRQVGIFWGFPHPARSGAGGNQLTMVSAGIIERFELAKSFCRQDFPTRPRAWSRCNTSRAGRARWMPRQLAWPTGFSPQFDSIRRLGDQRSGWAAGLLLEAHSDPGHLVEVGFKGFQKVISR